MNEGEIILTCIDEYFISYLVGNNFMTKSPQKTDKLQGIEYIINTVDQASGESEKQDVKTEMTEALAAAEEMLKSGKYSKVEVRQKYFDKKKDRDIDVVLKVFEAKKKLEINAAMIFIFAVLCGGLAFAATYFLTR